jgi:hypothetical protein
MPSFSVLRSVMATAGAFLVLTACAPGDAASETPVDLAPGEYHVTMNAGGLGMLAALGKSQAPGAVDDRICVSRRDASDFPEALVRRYLSFGDSCTLDAKDRQGNAIGGALTCAADRQRMPDSAFVIRYQGAIAADGVETTSKIEVRLSDAALVAMDPGAVRQMRTMGKTIEKIDVGLTAKRTGDCG